MNTIINNAVCICLLFLLIENNHALRCRSGNQEMNDEAEKVMLKCKRHHSESDKNSDSSSADMSSEEDSSSLDSSIFNREFFADPRKDLQDSVKNSKNGSASRGNGHEYKKQSGIQPSYMEPINDTRMRENQHRMSNSNSDNGFMMNRNQHNNQRTTDDDFRGKSCSAQCFFDEFNSVNQQGFPERTPVTRMILRGIQDPTLRDFIEQSIFECFQFLDSRMKSDKCTFSQNLLNCLADKGRENCEDWND